MARRGMHIVGVGAAVLGLVGLATVSPLSPAAPAKANIVIQVCNINVNWPHGSTHVTGTINATSTISCSTVMPNLRMQNYLVRTDGALWSKPLISYLNVTYLPTNASTGCSAGPANFMNHTYYNITFPPGYTPQNYEGWHDSPWVGVACGGVSAASQSLSMKSGSGSDTIPVMVTPPQG